METLFRTRGYFAQRRETERQAEEILEFLRLKNQRDVLARNLSYGDQRRLEIGIALASRREFLLLDEPAAGMNPEETQTLSKDIQQIRKKGITIFLIEHHMQTGDGDLRPDRGPQLRKEDRRRHPSGDQSQSSSHRSLLGERGRFCLS